MVAIALICGLVGWKNRNQNSQTRLLLLYPIASATETLWSYINLFTHADGEGSEVMNSLINLFLIFEFSLLFLFYQFEITNRIFKRIILVIGLAYVVLCTTRFIFIQGFFENISYFFAIHSLFILALGVTWVCFMFSDKPTANLPNNPALWVTAGAFVYFLSTIPLFLAAKFVFDPQGIIIEAGIYSINYICYTILFILLTRAFLCRHKEKQLSL